VSQSLTVVLPRRRAAALSEVEGADVQPLV
jgi:hypothetical protein